MIKKARHDAGLIPGYNRNIIAIGDIGKVCKYDRIWDRMVFSLVFRACEVFFNLLADLPGLLGWCGGTSRLGTDRSAGYRW